MFFFRTFQQGVSLSCGRPSRRGRLLPAPGGGEFGEPPAAGGEHGVQAPHDQARTAGLLVENPSVILAHNFGIILVVFWGIPCPFPDSPFCMIATS